MSYCEWCGKEMSAGAAFCSACGRRVDAAAPVSAPSASPAWAPPQQPLYPGAYSRSGDQPFSIAGIICGAIAFLFFPILLGPLGLILGAVGMSRGERLGRVAIAVSACGLVVGMIIGLIVFSSVYD